MDCLERLHLPQLQLLHSGKVRDSFRATPQSRLIVVSDRLSAFDFILKTPIPYKGAVLNGISNWWFAHTADLLPNHFLQAVDPNVTLVREAAPIKVEMVVRGYITGSVWRGYTAGEREFSGVLLPNGLQKNDAFPHPIVTPTTKEKNDRPISPLQLVTEGWVSANLYEKMEAAALQLYTRGATILKEKGIVLVDTKYEFGLLDDNLILIDEIHTPDSSRFWYLADYLNNPAQAEQIDKEYIRQWMLGNLIDGAYPTSLPDNVVDEASKRYLQIYESVCGQALQIDETLPVRERIVGNLQKAGFF